MMQTDKVIERLHKENIQTWFDIGLFLDKIRIDRKSLYQKYQFSYSNYKRFLQKTGIAFLTFKYSVDGITFEMKKYLKSIKNIFQEDIPIHYISGYISPKVKVWLEKEGKIFIVREIRGFDKWSLYKKFFFIKLQRGSEDYNSLIKDFWNETLFLVKKLGYYIEKNEIKTLFLLNVCSNPGNVSLALACVLVSELLEISVINNNHDFYWDGVDEKDKSSKKKKKNPRAFFFTNSHLGEIFTLLETLYPWESKIWFNVNINQSQSINLIQNKGHNPANIYTVNTAVELNEYRVLSKRQKINAFLQIKNILSGYNEKLTVFDIDSYIDDRKRYSGKDYQPVLLGSDTIEDFDFLRENIIFLQPTRIVKRKTIEVNFLLIKKLFENEKFLNQIKEQLEFKITILVTGPVELGNDDYFLQILEKFSEFLNTIKGEYKNNILLGFLFSEFDKKGFKNRYKQPITLSEIYFISSLALLPSQSEGRGLPIIESSAYGVPIFCRRYQPEEVYSDVIGEHLSEKEKIKVFEFRNKGISSSTINEIVNFIFNMKKNITFIEHNRNVVRKRFSFETLQENIEKMFYQFYFQIQYDKISDFIAEYSLEEYKCYLENNKEGIGQLLKVDKQHYLPGYGKMSFMIYLKSLIDPSFFRVEEQELKGLILDFTRNLVGNINGYSLETILRFYNSVYKIFSYYKGDLKIQHDHSMTYRYRNMRYYYYQDYTYQEIKGIVHLIYHKYFGNTKNNISLNKNTTLWVNWRLALLQLTDSETLGIDDRERLISFFKNNVPIAFFSEGYNIEYELEVLLLQPVRSILKLKDEEELTEKLMLENINKFSLFYIFVSTKIPFSYSIKQLEDFFKNTTNKELYLLYKNKICRIVETEQWTVGVHIKQVGSDALIILNEIKEKGGFLISIGEDSAMMMLDSVRLNRFHIGKATRILTSKIMGIPLNSGFIQFIPSGGRTTIGYPTLVQNSRQFSEALKSDLFQKVKEKIGEDKIFELLEKDAEKKGTPINDFLFHLDKNDSHESILKRKNSLEFSYIKGVYEDGLSWSGSYAKVNMSLKNNWNFIIYNTKSKPSPVPNLIDDYRNENKFEFNEIISWNGGYILNAELIGKMGLPEKYIGSPLGLLIINKEILSSPLFNKPAILIYEDGKIDIQKVNIKKGFTLSDEDSSLVFMSDFYNKHSNTNPCFYDLLFSDSYINGDGNIILQLAGNIIQNVTYTKKNQFLKQLPVGLTLSIPPEKLPKGWNKIGKKLKFTILSMSNVKDFEKVAYAVEAGPTLIENGKPSILMEKEGWTTLNSIRTQAARLDYTYMRGPKIAMGIDKDNHLIVLVINGRIRESVGATYQDIANILISLEAVKAMAFDPGGSATLYINNKLGNISPYNKNYQEDVYSLPPEPRFVSNIILGWTK